MSVLPEKSHNLHRWGGGCNPPRPPPPPPTPHQLVRQWETVIFVPLRLNIESLGETKLTASLRASHYE